MDSERNPPRALAKLRAEIDRCDERLIDLLASRRDLAVQIASVKRENGLDPVDTRREAAVVRRSAEIARRKELDDEQVRALFWRLIAISRKVQESSAAPAGADCDARCGGAA